MTDRTPLVKRAISPVKVTVELEFSQINEKGTFSRVKLINGPDWMGMSSPFTGGGSCYFKLDNDATLKTAGIKLEEGSSAKKAPAKQRKLF